MRAVNAAPRVYARTDLEHNPAYKFKLKIATRRAPVCALSHIPNPLKRRAGMLIRFELERDEHSFS